MTVLDASALLALARREPGASSVQTVLASGHISAANASEFLQKMIRWGANGRLALEKLERMGLVVHEVTKADAYSAANMWAQTKPFGLSLADRFCLSLGLRLEVPVVTADAVWADVAEVLGLHIRVIRP